MPAREEKGRGGKRREEEGRGGKREEEGRNEG